MSAAAVICGAAIASGSVFDLREEASRAAGFVSIDSSTVFMVTFEDFLGMLAALGTPGVGWVGLLL